MLGLNESKVYGGVQREPLLLDIQRKGAWPRESVGSLGQGTFGSLVEERDTAVRLCISVVGTHHTLHGTKRWSDARSGNE